MSPPLDWTYAATEVGENGLAVTRVATADERAALAAAVDIVSCDNLEATFQLRALGQGRYHLTGRLDARVTQSCVISLESVAARIEQPFDIEFRPPQMVEDETDGDREILSGGDIEPFEHGRLDVGRVVFELLSASLDPYPRKGDADFTWTDPKETAAGKANPFAVLAKLKGAS